MHLRYALRTLGNAPAFTVIVVLTLGLGIGANTAIFSLTDQILLRLLPVKSPEQLVLFENPGAFAGRQFNNNTFSYPMYRDFRDRNTVFSGVLARFPAPLTLMTNGQSERVNGELVTGNYFDLLGVHAIIGRALTPDDDRVPGGHPVAVLSHDYWTRRFAADPRVLNQTVSLNGHPMTIVGVAQAGFHGIVVGESPDVMVPVMMKAEMTPTWNDLENRRSRWLTLMARLKPGVPAAQAESAMNVMYRQINEEEVKGLTTASQRFRERFVSNHLFLRPGQKGRSELRQQFSTPIFVLMGMVGLVLLIACANVANLLLARGAARQREVAIRLALGATRAAIIRQRLVESAACRRRRRAGPSDRVVDREPPAQHAAVRRSGADALRVAGRARDRVCAGDRRAHGAALRPRAGAAIDTAGAHLHAQGRSRQRRRRHGARAVSQRPRRRAGWPVGPAPRRRGAVRAQPLQPEDAQPGLPGRPAARFLDRPVAQRLYARARERDLPAASGAARDDFRRAVGDRVGDPAAHRQ